MIPMSQCKIKMKRQRMILLYLKWAGMELYLKSEKGSWTFSWPYCEAGIHVRERHNRVVLWSHYQTQHSSLRKQNY